MEVMHVIIKKPKTYTPVTSDELNGRLVGQCAMRPLFKISFCEPTTLIIIDISRPLIKANNNIYLVIVDWTNEIGIAIYNSQTTWFWNVLFFKTDAGG